MMRSPLSLPAALVVAVLAVGSAPVSKTAADAAAPKRLRVAAAADMRFALDALVAEFRRARPDIDVTVSYGSSGTFYAQLLNRAPFDLFLSADVEYPARLASRGLTVPGTTVVYAVGRLVVWLPRRTNIDIERLGLAALDTAAVRHVALANPEHAPYGRAAIAALQQSGLLERLRPKLVYAENVVQALQFAESGGAEAGIIALSLAAAPPVTAAGRYWLIPSRLHPSLEQAGAILMWAADRTAARDLQAFMQAASGRAILKRFGFVPEEK